MTYTPQPGTIPERVLKHFRELPPDSCLSAAEIAEALDIDQNVVPQCLQAAVKHYVLYHEVRPYNGRKTAFYRLGDGNAPLDVVDPDPPKQTTVPATSVFGIAADDLVKHYQPPKASRLVSGVFTDGSVVVRKGKAEVLLDTDEADQLFELMAKARRQVEGQGA